MRDVCRSRSLCLIVLGLVLAQMVSADEIVLRDGTRLLGILANREVVAANPERYSYVALLMETPAFLEKPAEYVRIPVRSIQYAVLTDGERRRVVEFPGEAVSSEGEQRTLYHNPAHAWRQQSGAVLMWVGASAGAVGWLHKFDEGRMRSTEHGLVHEEDAYNGTNYALMVGGSLLFIVGLVRVLEPAYYTAGGVTPRVGMGADGLRVCASLAF